MKKIYVFFVFIFLIIKNIPPSYGEDINLEASVLSISSSGKKKINDVNINIDNVIKIMSDFVTFENDDIFEFIGNVMADVEQDIKVTCKKCTYNRYDKMIVFHDVEIIKNDVVFVSKKCFYSIKKKCLEYKDGGNFYKDNINIFGKKGTINIEKEIVKISNNINIDMLFNDKNIKIQCDMFEYNIPKKQILLDTNIKIELYIDNKNNKDNKDNKENKDKFTINSGHNVRYEIDSGKFFFGKIKFNYKNNIGISNTAVFDYNKSAIKIEGNVNLKLSNGSELTCEKINYNFLNNNGLCDGKPTINIDNNTKVAFEDISFSL